MINNINSLCKALSPNGKLKVGIFATNLAIQSFNERYPTDVDINKAINAAWDYLADPTPDKRYVCYTMAKRMSLHSNTRIVGSLIAAALHTALIQMWLKNEAAASEAMCKAVNCAARAYARSNSAETTDAFYARIIKYGVTLLILKQG